MEARFNTGAMHSGIDAQPRAAALTGRPPADYPKSIELCASAPRLLEPIPVGDGTALLRRRPDVREAERELACGYRASVSPPPIFTLE